MSRLSRLLNPSSVAVIGGVWAENVITQLIKSGYSGKIWPVHPKKYDIYGLPYFPSLQHLPSAPDAAFVGVNRNATIKVIETLSAMESGGAICFASGFQEAGNEALQSALIEAAGAMTILGPNCYGLINYLDNAVLWPDQHGGISVEKGVGILAQSSNIAINISMQKRGLDIGQIITIGNQAQTDIADLIEAQVKDPRITAIGLYLEGFGDMARFEAAALKACGASKPIVVIKAGLSEKSQIAAMSHTASLAGNAIVSSAFLKRLGIIEVSSTAVFLETLKILDRFGSLSGAKLSSVSCSGGEASMMADIGESLGLNFPDFPAATLNSLSAVLGPDVSLSNPLDYHTYIWGDIPKMTQCFEAVMRSDMDLNIFVLDIPRSDRCDPSSFTCAIEAIIAAQKNSKAPVAVLTHLSENMDEAIIARFKENDIVVLNGMETGLCAVKAAIGAHLNSIKLAAENVWLSEACQTDDAIILAEHEAKTALAAYGLNIPKHCVCAKKADIADAAQHLSFPLALKTLGLAHKTEVNGVILNIHNAKHLEEASVAIADTGEGFLLEEMSPKPIAELIIGITRDSTGLLALTLGAGGVLAELLQDSVTLVLPVLQDDVLKGLHSLKINKILSGYRGQATANIDGIIEAVMAVLRYVQDHKDQILELDINPLMAGTHEAMAVDALIKLKES